MADLVYVSALVAEKTGGVDYSSDDLRVLLVADTYVWDAAHEYVSDVLAHECSGTGYSRKTLDNVSVGAVGDECHIDADDVAWTALDTNEAIAGAITYVHTGNDATASLRFYSPLAAAVTPNGADYTHQWAAPMYVSRNAA